MDLLKNNLVVGVGVALAATVLAPALIPAIGSAGRPLAKTLLKGALRLYDRGREALALAGESMEDMLAEVRAEDALEQSERSAAAERAREAQAPAPPAAERYGGDGEGPAIASRGDGHALGQEGMDGA